MNILFVSRSKKNKIVTKLSHSISNAFYRCNEIIYRKCRRGKFCFVSRKTIYILCFTKERTLLSVLFTLRFKLICCSKHSHAVCWKLNYTY